MTPLGHKSDISLLKSIESYAINMKRNGTMKWLLTLVMTLCLSPFSVVADNMLVIISGVGEGFPQANGLIYTISTLCFYS